MVVTITMPVMVTVVIDFPILSHSSLYGENEGSMKICCSIVVWS